MLVFALFLFYVKLKEEGKPSWYRNVDAILISTFRQIPGIMQQ
jgi:hypothetical protein